MMNLRKLKSALRLLYLRFKRPSPYIIWDGISVAPFYPTKGHDCVVLTDGLVSVQNLRRDCIISGKEPIVIFSCKRHMPTYEVNYPVHGWGGLFTQSMTKVLYPGITIKELIKQTNAEMNKSGLIQVCEVICRLNQLKLEYLTANHKGKKILYMQFDMCRTQGNWGLKIKNK
jgi:hypothetical protein